MMELMTGRGIPRRVRTVAAFVALAGMTMSACSGSSDSVAEAAPTSAPARTTTTAAPTTSTTTTTTTTTVAPTTTSTTTSTSTSTTTTSTTTSTSTSTTTTTVVQETEPIAPPSDSYAKEPVIEVGSIAIPKLGVDMTMYEGIRLTTLDYGPGHWPGTAMPGEIGNVVVGGHRTSKHRIFRNVDQLVPGDEIIFRDDDGEHVYLVNRVEIVEPTAIWIVDPTETATATLFACHPPGSTAQRIVVFADLAT
jgi:sortase A